ncbi:hypothetical protein GSI_10278 [Ganoderma sinense ZZ0214-1]|uniref:Uncharacterized protein n=1 Tax=Ganoderma sinense ZZ0214-1 TaxID=1077348 RepID=A0A2G8S065_9APHY|nr:hypothetical protein GSI_10278 [Ganoderma sinense ZZ0214-1]
MSRAWQTSQSVPSERLSLHWAQPSYYSFSNRTSVVPSPLSSALSSSVTPTSVQDPSLTSMQDPSPTSRHAFNSHDTKSGIPSTLSPSDTAPSLTALWSVFFSSRTDIPTNNRPIPNLTSPPNVAPGSSPPSPSPESTNSSTSPSASPHLSTPDTLSANTDAIAGGVVGGVAFLTLLAIGAFLLVRHRRKSRPPPSAEFMHLARGPSELGFATMDGKKSPTLHRLMPGPLARRGSLEDEENLPPLSPTLSYHDPVLEKAQESAAMREKYIGSEEGGYQ